jgi:hypothetical protein
LEWTGSKPVETSQYRLDLQQQLQTVGDLMQPGDFRQSVKKTPSSKAKILQRTSVAARTRFFVGANFQSLKKPI